MTAPATSPAPAPQQGAANQASVESMRGSALVRREEPDYSIDFFSAKGFALAQRLAQAFSTSNAVPAAFRNFNEKRLPGGGVEWVENPAAMGNCLVAIETARAVGVSITSVMQNANVIEGRLTWSAQYKIAAINASHRFTPLRFDVKNKGVIKASYREKLGWNKQKGGFDFREVEVELENLVCIAWALPANVAFPNGVHTLDQARAAGLPVIESAPVSMKLAVEEGWYGKAGSKWQTELKHLMLQYRAGSFFGNIHAPDVVMGMGRTTEEMQDITTVDVAPDGRITGVTTEELRRPAGETPPAEVVTQKNTVGSESEHPPEGEAGQDDAKKQDQTATEPLTFAHVADAIAKATTAIEVQAARALIPRVVDAEQQAELNAKVAARETEIAKPAAKSRRGASAAAVVE